MPGYSKTSGIKQIGPRCLYTPRQGFCPRISWPKRDQIVWPRWRFQPWPPLWISHSKVTGHYVQLEPCAITWTGPQISGRTKCWSLSPSRKVFTRTYFIALIHPIQWTIAYPVGADRPAKRQKKTSCVSTGQAGPVLCTRQMACRTSFLSRQSDVIASFSFGACTCDTVFSENIYFQVLCENYYVFCF